MNHELIVEDLGRWGFGLMFQARCTCRLWEGQKEDNRPAAIRHHTLHVHQATAVWA